MKLKQRRLRLAGLVLALAALFAILVPLAMARAAPGPTASTTTRQIAVSTLDNDFRTTLTAIRGPSEGGAPVATVKVAAYQRSGGGWKLIGRQTVGDPNSWFWNVVTGPGAVCRFSTSDVAPHPIEVRLLVSQSIGCSEVTYNFHVDQFGNLVAG
jgi:hypothetical protein